MGFRVSELGLRACGRKCAAQLCFLECHCLLFWGGEGGT